MMKGILHIVELDLRNFFSYKWWLVGLISMNLADLFIMAVVYNFMLSSQVTRANQELFQLLRTRTRSNRPLRVSLHDRTRSKHGTPPRNPPLHAQHTHEQIRTCFWPRYLRRHQRPCVHDTPIADLLRIRGLPHRTPTTLDRFHAIHAGDGHLRTKHINCRVHLELRKIRYR